jgi:hypothetical protein
MRACPTARVRAGVSCRASAWARLDLGKTAPAPVVPPTTTCAVLSACIAVTTPDDPCSSHAFRYTGAPARARQPWPRVHGRTSRARTQRLVVRGRPYSNRKGPPHHQQQQHAHRHRQRPRDQPRRYKNAWPTARRAAWVGAGAAAGGGSGSGRGRVPAAAPLAGTPYTPISILSSFVLRLGGAITASGADGAAYGRGRPRR